MVTTNDVLAFGNSVFDKMYDIYYTFLTESYVSQVQFVYNSIFPIVYLIFSIYIAYRVMLVIYGDNLHNMILDIAKILVFLIAIYTTLKTSTFVFDIINSIKNGAITILSQGKAHNAGEMVQSFYTTVIGIVDVIENLPAGWGENIVIGLVSLFLTGYATYVAGLYFFRLLSSEFLLILLFILSPIFLYLRIYKRTENYYNSFIQGIVSNILILALNTLALSISILFIQKLFTVFGLNDLEKAKLSYSTLGGLGTAIFFCLEMTKFIGQYASALATQLSNSSLGASTQDILGTGIAQSTITRNAVKGTGMSAGIAGQAGKKFAVRAANASARTAVSGAKSGYRAASNYFKRKGTE